MELKKPLILASSSPRRQFLMSEAGFHFTVKKPDVDEVFPEDMAAKDVAKYLAGLKAGYFNDEVKNAIVITADTVVILDGKILNKPGDRNEAIGMLRSLSGQTHTVRTGVCIRFGEESECFDDVTEVTFEKLSQADIEFYIDTFQPFDKAGSYGAQDCLEKGMNPFSQDEVEFLESIGKTELIRQTIENNRIADKHIAIIKKLSGSYFNVMGLPIHLVHERLGSFSR